jgi:hypothetical protein
MEAQSPRIQKTKAAAGDFLYEPTGASLCRCAAAEIARMREFPPTRRPSVQTVRQ